MSDSQKELVEFAQQQNVPILKDEAQEFLIKLIQEENKKEILELGTAIAYTSIALAKSDKGIVIDTIEKNPKMSQQAINNIQKAGVQSQINCFAMNIDDFVATKKYDVIFVDAAKAQYEKYLYRFTPYLKKDGFFFFDNMIFHGMIYRVQELKNRSTRCLVKKIVDFRRKISLNNDYKATFYDNIGDGILIVRRRDKHES